MRLENSNFKQNDLETLQIILHEMTENAIRTLSELNVDFKKLTNSEILLIGYNITISINNICNSILHNFSNKCICFRVNDIDDSNNLICSFVILRKDVMFNESNSTDDDIMRKYIEIVSAMENS